MGLEIGARQKGTGVVQEGINVASGIPDRYTDIDRYDRVVSRRLRTREGESASQLGLSTAYARESISTLRSSTGKSKVVLNRDGLRSANIADRVFPIRICVVGFGVERDRHKVP